MQLSTVKVRPSTVISTESHWVPLKHSRSLEQARKQVPFEPQKPERHSAPSVQVSPVRPLPMAAAQNQSRVDPPGARKG
jgi:hypothetical protein